MVTVTVNRWPSIYTIYNILHAVYCILYAAKEHLHFPYSTEIEMMIFVPHEDSEVKKFEF